MNLTDVVSDRYDMGGYKIGAKGWQPYPRSVWPKLYKPISVNSYLVDLETENIELIRFVANTLCQAEKAITINQRLLYCIVYRMEMGKSISSATDMIVLLPFLTETKYGRNRLNYQASGTYFGNYYEVDPYNIFLQISRHTLRGSGRYKAVCQYDFPRFYSQSFPAWRDWSDFQPSKTDPFIGLDVAFGRNKGKALKHVYAGSVDPANYVLDEQGRIVLHTRGPLFHGGFDSYRKSMSAIWPLFSKKALDKDGKLVEGNKVVDHGFPNLVSEFKAQRRASYSKQGNFGVFQRRLFLAIYQYMQLWTNLVNAIQQWGHNLNYDVDGFQGTELVYVQAEKILRLIAAHFPNSLTFDASRASIHSSFPPLESTEHLRLGNRAKEIGEVWDSLVVQVDWMRRNWIEYKPRDFLPPVVYSQAKQPNIVSNGPYPARENMVYSPPKPDVARATASLAAQGFKNIKNVRISEPIFVAQNNLWYLRFVEFYADSTSPGQEAWTLTVPWSGYNQWLEITADIAADIEHVYLSFQLNGLNFFEMATHFLAICDAKPMEDKKRAKGHLPGEILRTHEHDLNRKRTYPRVKVPVKITGTPGKIQDIPKPTAPMFDLKFYTIDARALVPRCASDNKKRDEDEAEEEGEIQRKIKDARDRQKFADQQKINDAKRARAAEKPRFIQRSEIDATDAAELERERGNMYSQIADNLGHVIDAEQAIEGAVSYFVGATAPETTPLVIEERVVSSEVAIMAKKAVRDVAENKIEEWFASEPEFNPQGRPAQIDPGTYTFDPLPRVAHEYAPPKTSQEFPHTGAEGTGRNYEEIFPPPNVYPESAVRNEEGRWFQPPNAQFGKEDIEAVEPSHGKQLQEGDVRSEDEIPPQETGYRRWREKRPLDRYRCIRGTKRVPRP
jgi:hypothetical protein